MRPCCGRRTGGLPNRPVVGMAALQAAVVHRGVTYDVELDTARIPTTDCAHLIINHLTRAEPGVTPRP